MFTSAIKKRFRIDLFENFHIIYIYKDKELIKYYIKKYK